MCYFLFYFCMYKWCVSEMVKMSSWNHTLIMFLVMFTRCLPTVVDIFKLSGGGGELRTWLTFLLCSPASPSLPDYDYDDDDTTTQYLSLVLWKSPQRCRFLTARFGANGTIYTVRLLRTRLKWVHCCLCLMSTETAMGPSVVLVYFRDHVAV